MQGGIQLLSKFPVENRREFIRSFKILPQFDGCRKNCGFSRLFEDVGELNSFLWVEYWRNENAMEEYLQSDRFKTILGAIETLGELIHFNKIQFHNIQQQKKSKKSRK
jgi:quinol monooxygenase YgiN